MVSYKYKCVYVHIPKTAGTSLEKYLCLAEDEPVDKHRQFLPGCGDGRQHLFLDEVLSHPDFSGSRGDFFCFSVVRNPWDWFLSLVRYWMRRGCLVSESSDLKANFFNLLKLDHIDNHRLCSQTRYLSCGGKIGVDHVCRFEHLDKDFEEVRRALGLPCDPPLPKLNSAGDRLCYTDVYDSEMIEAVEKRYGEDIKTFGYKFQG